MRDMKKDDKGQFTETHGVYSFEEKGEEALTPIRRGYLAELKQRLATEEGREECRVDLAAALGTIVELGFSNLQQDATAGKDIWSGGILARLGVYVNAYIRILDNWPEGKEKPKNIIDALKGRIDDEQAD